MQILNLFFQSFQQTHKGTERYFIIKYKKFKDLFLNISHKESPLYVWCPDNEMWDMTDGDQMILENFHFLSSHKTLLKEREDNLLFSKMLSFGNLNLKVIFITMKMTTLVNWKSNLTKYKFNKYPTDGTHFKG